VSARVYWGTRHVRQSAVHALSLRLSEVIAGVSWSEEQWPTPEPDTVQTFAGPWSALPDGGGVFFRDPLSGDRNQVIPFITVQDVGHTRRAEEDGECDWYDVTLEVRARVGMDADSPLPLAPDMMHAQADALCQAAAVTVAEFIRAAALALQPDAAFGICWARIDRPPEYTPDSPAPPKGMGQSTCDYTATVIVTQRRFAAAGVGSVDLTPAPLPLLTDLGAPILTDLNEPILV